jgi:TonB family protein
MPELPGGGGVKAIAAAIRRRVAYPPLALRAGAAGQVVVGFAITPAGYVRKVHIIKAFRFDCGRAVLRAVWQLPRFRPRPPRLGMVNYAVPVAFKIAAGDGLRQPRPARKKALPKPAASHRSVAAPASAPQFVSYFEPMPELMANGRAQSIEAAVRQRLIYPPHSGLVCLTGRAFVRFTITPTGEVARAEVVKGIWPPFDSAALNAVRQLPCFKPRPQAASCTVPVRYGQEVR